MNKEQRARLSKCVEMLFAVKTVVEEIGEEEQEKFDNLSGGLQLADRGLKMEEAASSLSDLGSTLDDVIDTLNNVQEG